MLNISVENEAAYFSCKVKERTSKGNDPRPNSGKFITEVEDTNNPPRFSVTVKEAMLEENTPIGTCVEKVTAADPESSHAEIRDFV